MDLDVCIDDIFTVNFVCLMCFDCMQPMQKLSGDTLLKNLHPDLRLYVVKELSIPRPLGFCVLIFNFRFYSFHIVYIMLFIMSHCTLSKQQGKSR